MRFFGLKIHPHHLPSPIKKLRLTFGKTATSGWGFVRFSWLFQVSLPQKCKSEKICQKKKTGIKHLRSFSSEVLLLFRFFFNWVEGKEIRKPQVKIWQTFRLFYYLLFICTWTYFASIVKAMRVQIVLANTTSVTLQYALSSKLICWLMKARVYHLN